MNNTHQCPNCKSHDIYGAKFDFNPGSMYEFKCNKCGLYEYKSSWEDGFVAWKSRWYTSYYSSKDQHTTSDSDKQIITHSIVQTPVKTTTETTKAVKEEEYYDFYSEQTDNKHILYWLFSYSHKAIWQFLNLLQPKFIIWRFKAYNQKVKL